MPINRTLVIGANFVLAEEDRRRNIFNCMKGIPLSSFSEQRTTLNAGVYINGSTSYSSITFSVQDVFVLVVDNPVELTVTNNGGSTVLTVSDMFIITGQVSTILVTNKSTTEIATINTIVG